MDEDDDFVFLGADFFTVEPFDPLLRVDDFFAFSFPFFVAGDVSY